MTNVHMNSSMVPPPLLHAVDVSPYVINPDWLDWRAQEFNGGPGATVTPDAFDKALAEATRSIVERNADVFAGREVETVTLSSSPSSPYIVKIKRK